jgi:hypothetical protein
MAAQPPVSAWKVKEIKSTGVGCIVQLLALILGGVLLLSFFPIGILVGVALIVAGLVWGRQLATKWSCDNCKNPIANGEVKICPVCHATLWTSAEAKRHQASMPPR